jgi:hypothetical protein
MDILVILAQSWWEPGTPGALDVGDLSAILGFVVAAFGTFVAIMRWWLNLLKAIIKEEIEKATEPINPNANGGLSLADVARRTIQVELQLERVFAVQGENRDMLIKLVNKVVDIEEDLEDLEGGK